MRFHIAGIGSIGTLIAFHLRKVTPTQHSITLLLRPGKLATVVNKDDFAVSVEREGNLSSVRGFEVESLPDGHPSLGRLPSGSKDSGSTRHISSLFVACKAYSTSDVLTALRPRLTSESTVVLFQNGTLAVYDELIENVFNDPDERPNFVLVSNNHGAYVKEKEKFHVVHAGMGTLRFAIVPKRQNDSERSLRTRDLRNDNMENEIEERELNLREEDESLKGTVNALQSLTALHSIWESYSTLQVELRRKLVVNCVINPLTAILGCRNGALFAEPHSLRVAERVCAEAEAVFSSISNSGARNLKVLPGLDREALLSECVAVAEKTGQNTSSMLADVRNGKSLTEIDYLNGYLVKLGSRKNIDCRTNSLLMDLVKARLAIGQGMSDSPA